MSIIQRMKFLGAEVWKIVDLMTHYCVQASIMSFAPAGETSVPTLHLKWFGMA